MLKEKNDQHRILYPAKIHFRNEDEIRILSDKIERTCYQQTFRKEIILFFWQKENDTSSKVIYCRKERIPKKVINKWVNLDED